MGNECIKKLIFKMKNISKICEINDGSSEPISRSRPIKTYQDKKDFDTPLKNLEKKRNNRKKFLTLVKPRSIR